MSWISSLDSFAGARETDAPLLALSAREWQVIGLAINEARRAAGSGIASRWRRMFGLLTGIEAPRPLADPRLEALRGFVCAARTGRSGAETLAARLMELGFSADQVSAVRMLAAR
ncbi:hypothetical protein G432_02675 [Sphingomonas sp. MM-1]|uniref:hypothetical protein n=1 Tax=Sphingomonas sp. MM-1 TaxID=745310 RepID=UPI0002C12CA8|nr:hypothetical protein [Sphingomonas sp. MM-1]AGH48262.1 hypothetical protein G432_02675 [Sphingomonas sp. MM-1]